MPKKAFIGIDTSNYTTSFAISDYDGNIIKNYREKSIIDKIY